MKKLGYLTIAVVAVVLILYVLARLALPQNMDLSSAVEVRQQEAAAYPSDFEKRLARMGDISVQLLTERELPKAINWTSVADFPPIGSAQATKGGTLRLCNVGPFPANFLAFGSPSPQFFHYNLFDRIEVPLVREHPQTGQTIPGLAEAWASHGELLLFRIHPSATYSNGRPVRAADFLLGALLRHEMGDKNLAMYADKIEVYGDKVLAIRPKTTALNPHLKAANMLHPAEPSFYAEFGSDYATRYAQQIPPTTGAYIVTKIEKGRLIQLSRNNSWWAKNERGFRYTHNADTIEHNFLTDEAQAWEMFLRGRLDIMQTRNIVAWQEYLKNADSRITEHRLEFRSPMPPYGIALNTKQLPDLNLRLGLMHSMDMQRAMNIIFRGEAERLPQFATGYRHLTHVIPQYQYDPTKARAKFAAAGYTKTGADGILQKNDGSRLSVRLAFTPSEKISTMVTILAQSAAACGAEIIPEPLPWQNCSNLVRDEKHQMIFWATVAGTHLPDYRRSFHSSATGDDAPFGLKDAEMDATIEQVESSATLEAVTQACEQADKIIYKRAIWLPGWMENRINVAAWPHVHLPDEAYNTYDVAESHTYWLSN